MTSQDSGNKSFDLLANGDIVLEDGIVRNGWVAVQQVKITEIFDSIPLVQASEVITAGNKLILPGAIDGHVHCYSNPAEGFVHATESAAAGGVTTIVDMPYDAGGPVISIEVFEAKHDLVGKEAVTDVALLATIRKEGGLDEIPGLASAGACGFKVSLFETDPERFPQICDHELLKAFELVQQTGLLIGVHAENNEIVRKETSLQKHSRDLSHIAFARSRPKVAEAEASLRAMEFAYTTGVHLHIFHISCPRIFKMINWYKAQGATIIGENCTHYLSLVEGDLATLKGKAKINPPIRSKADQDGLWELCAENMVDMVTSDHAPWPEEKKINSDIFKCASGAPGVELLLPMLFSSGVARQRISIFDMVKLVSGNPAKLFGFSLQKGGIFTGADADLVIFDPNQEWIVNEKLQRSVAGWSPYNDIRLRGKVCRTLVRGRTVYNDNEITATKGYGRFVAPDTFNP